MWQVYWTDTVRKVCSGNGCVSYTCSLIWYGRGKNKRGKQKKKNKKKKEEMDKTFLSDWKTDRCELVPEENVGTRYRSWGKICVWFETFLFKRSLYFHNLRYAYFPRDWVHVRTSVTSRGLPCFVQASSGLFLTRTLECLLTSRSCHARPANSVGNVGFDKKQRSINMAIDTVINKMWRGGFWWRGECWNMSNYSECEPLNVWTSNYIT